MHLYRDIEDRATLEREYSPSSCVDDITVLLAEYDERSRRVRADHPNWRSHVYGTHPDERLDHFAAPDGPRPAPVVVYIHGGYWQQLGPADHSFPAAGFSARGVDYVALGYGLAPAATMAVMVRRCRSAIGWLVDQAAELGIDPDRIHLAGSSAGAHLAAMTALGWPTPEPPLASLTLLSGVFDLRPIPLTYVNDAVGLSPTDALLHSPLLMIDTFAGAWPPTIVAVGENETAEFHRQSAEMAATLTRRGARADHLVVPGRNHFDLVFDLADPTTPVGESLDRFIAEPHHQAPREPREPRDRRQPTDS